MSEKMTDIPVWKFLFTVILLFIGYLVAENVRVIRWNTEEIKQVCSQK